jgi:hypothetical protein
MGASCWTYFVPYSHDVESAFKKLQQDVFVRGDFYTSETNRNQKFESIEDLRDEQEDEGSHSILDMLRVSSAGVTINPEKELLAALFGDGTTSYGTVSQMTRAEIKDTFGSSKPTRKAIEAIDSVDCERGCGRYTIAYDDNGAPVWWYFYGVSGD